MKELDAALDDLDATVARGESAAAVCQDAQWVLEVAHRANALADLDVAKHMGALGFLEPALRLALTKGTISRKDALGLPLDPDHLSDLERRFGCFKSVPGKGWRPIPARSSLERRREKVQDAALSGGTVVLIRGSPEQRQSFAEGLALLIRSEVPESRFLHFKDSAALAAVTDSDVIFLEEMSTLSPMEQGAILALISEHAVKCIFATAGNGDLDEMVRMGRFREDLFYRIEAGLTAIDVTAHPAPAVDP